MFHEIYTIIDPFTLISSVLLLQFAPNNNDNNHPLSLCTKNNQSFLTKTMINKRCLHVHVHVSTYSIDDSKLLIHIFQI